MCSIGTHTLVRAAQNSVQVPCTGSCVNLRLVLSLRSCTLQGGQRQVMIMGLRMQNLGFPVFVRGMRPAHFVFEASEYGAEDMTLLLFDCEARLLSEAWVYPVPGIHCTGQDVCMSVWLKSGARSGDINCTCRRSYCNKPSCGFTLLPVCPYTNF